MREGTIVAWLEQRALSNMAAWIQRRGGGSMNRDESLFLRVVYACTGVIQCLGMIKGF